MLNNLIISAIRAILILYPLYQTFLCIKTWDKTTKPHFQHWVVFWFLWISTYYMKMIIEWLWIINIFTTFFDLITFTLLIGCYNRWIAFFIRKSLIIPIFKEIKCSYVKYAKNYISKIDINKFADYKKQIYEQLIHIAILFNKKKL